MGVNYRGLYGVGVSLRIENVGAGGSVLWLPRVVVALAVAVIPHEGLIHLRARTHGG